MKTRIIGTGSCLPETVVTNDDLAKIMDTSDEWISSRTGIRQRHLAKEETTAGMSAEAARRALDNAGVTAEEIDLIILGTVSADYVTPACACEVQAAIGAKHAVAFDINAACSGFMFALNIANAYIQAGIYRTALILGAETLSKIVDWKDRATCVLFGDGAGAAVVRGDETYGLLAFDQGCDGTKGDVLACPGRTNNNPLIETDRGLAYVHMDGQEVYKFAVTTVPASLQKTIEAAGLAPEDIDYYALHQANIRIIQSVSKRLRVSEDKFPISLDHCGNISAASVPILLDEMNRSGLLKPGTKIAMSGFGGGLTWASAVLSW
ncbi:MAG: ketoacyl-ACP synthase III [Bacteroidales bacterium]|nr:ketoacyl-ACP synthase III [Bacteroidales bacterium]MCM1416133.1 ketoacyl-ACP synthase III [bacterium]MCM1423048.1 ketoacyl-ACP synthase III [bacterium]